MQEDEDLEAILGCVVRLSNSACELYSVGRV